MVAASKPTSDKKPKAVPNANPFNLTSREVEILVLAWKCVEDQGKVDKTKLAKLANIPLADSAGRMFRKVVEKVNAAVVAPTSAPSTPGGTGNGGDKATITTATAAAVDPNSPSVVASDKKNKKKKQQEQQNDGTPAQTSGRKRTKKEADAEHSGDEGDKKNDSEDEGRPRKIPRFSPVGKPIAAQKQRQASEARSEDLQAAEA